MLYKQLSNMIFVGIFPKHQFSLKVNLYYLAQIWRPSHISSYVRQNVIDNNNCQVFGTHLSIAELQNAINQDRTSTITEKPR